MLPYRDDASSRRFTLVTSALILANVALFAFALLRPAASRGVVRSLALTPGRISAWAAHPRASVWPVATLVTSLFVHAGTLHLAGNMLYLFVFGPAVEEGLGAFGYLVLYMGAGVVSGLAQVAIAPGSMAGVVGASGAIAGVLGAYLLIHPRARVGIFPAIPWRRPIRELPATLYLIAWFALQLFAALGEAAPGGAGLRVAWWSHVAGFLFGAAAGPMLERPKAAQARRRSRH